MVGTGDSHDDRWSLLARVGKVPDPGPVGQRLPLLQGNLASKARSWSDRPDASKARSLATTN